MNARHSIVLATTTLLLASLAVWMLTPRSGRTNIASAELSHEENSSASDVRLLKPSSEPFTRQLESAVEPALSPAATSAVSVGPEQQLQENECTDETCTMKVRVRGPGDCLVTDALIALHQATPSVEEGSEAEGFEMTQPTNRQGDAYFFNVKVQVPLEIVVSGLGAESKPIATRTNVTCVAGSRNTFDLYLHAKDGFWVRGKLLGPQGMGLEDESIGLIDPAELPPLWPPPFASAFKTVESEREGVFSAFCVTRRELVVHADTNKGYQPVPVRVWPGGDPATIQLALGGTIKGRIDESHPDKTSGSTLGILFAQGPVSVFDERGLCLRASLVDPKGDFAIGGLADGVYSLVAMRQGFVQGIPSWYTVIHGVQITASETTQSIRVQVTPEKFARLEVTHSGQSELVSFVVVRDGLQLITRPRLQRDHRCSLLVPPGALELRWHAQDGSFGTEMLRLDADEDRIVRIGLSKK